MTKIEFHKEVPAEVRDAVEPILIEFQWLVPGWVQDFTVWWTSNPKEENVIATAHAQYEYRSFGIDFNPQFLDSDPAKRREVIVHELLHGFSCPFSDWVRDTIKDLVTEEDAPKFQKSLLRELTARHESWVQDTAFCIAQKFPLTVTEVGR